MPDPEHDASGYLMTRRHQAGSWDGGAMAPAPEPHSSGTDTPFVQAGDSSAGCKLSRIGLL